MPRQGTWPPVIRSQLSVRDSGVNRPTKYTASGTRGLFGQGIGQHETHHELGPIKPSPDLLE